MSARRPPARPRRPRSAPTAATIRVWSRARDLRSTSCVFDDRRPRLGRSRRMPLSARRARRVGAAPPPLLRARARATRSASTARPGPTTRSTRRTPCSTRTRADSRRAADGHGAASRSRRSPTTGSTGAASPKPRVPLDHTVIYEAHVQGLLEAATARSPSRCAAPTPASPTTPTIEYLTNLGVTTVELLPVHAFVDRAAPACSRASSTTGATTPSTSSPRTPPYAIGGRAGRAAPDAVLREFKGMVRLLHEAGLEVDPRRRLQPHRRGGPSAARRTQLPRHRQRDLLPPRRRTARYVDVDRMRQHRSTSRRPPPQRLVLDSLRYWANERADRRLPLRPGGDARARRPRRVHAEHPLLRAIARRPGARRRQDDRRTVGRRHGRLADRQLRRRAGRSGTTATATGCATSGSATCAASATTGTAGSGIGALRHAASPDRRTRSRSSAARSRAVNFVTAHDGFTLADLTAYDVKHNLGNGEHNRDGTDNNNSFNHGVEGATDDAGDPRDATAQRCATCSARCCSRPACPMLTAGDEFGRTPARQQQRVLPRLRPHLAVVGRDDVADASCSRRRGG